jgi:hypothetical protein
MAAMGMATVIWVGADEDITTVGAEAIIAAGDKRQAGPPAQGHPLNNGLSSPGALGPLLAYRLIY